MTIHRAKRTAVVVNPAGGRRVTVYFNQPYSDEDTSAKKLIKAYPDLFTTDDEIEQATQGPGEKRSTTRAKARKSLADDKKKSKKK